MKPLLELTFKLVLDADKPGQYFYNQSRKTLIHISPITPQLWVVLLQWHKLGNCIETTWTKRGHVGYYLRLFKTTWFTYINFFSVGNPRPVAFRQGVGAFPQTRPFFPHDETEIRKRQGTE